jgi:hypothetical protein
MDYLKEYSTESQKYVIRTDTYAHSVEHIQNMFAEAQKDFPDLQVKDVDVVYYAGQRFSRTFGIEFRAVGTIPDSYREIHQLEFTH